MAPTRTSEINVRQDTQHTTTDGCFQTSEPIFAMPKHGNRLTALTTGKDLFAEIASAINAARQFILFTDWQMDYDVELHERGSKDFRGRFSELLAKKVAQGVEVKALLYDSLEAAVYTHENEVRQNLMRLNPKASELGKNGAPPRNPAGNLPVEVALQRPVTGRAIENVLFSHHQKSIVIDGRVAFVGGMDVTYGRWCDNNFDVVADPVKHRINDLYNPCVSSGRRTTEKEENLTKDWAGMPKPADAKYGVARPGFAPPYYIIGVVSARIRDMLERGYTVEQLEDLIQLTQIDDQIRDYVAQKARELRALVEAIDRTLNRYGKAKAEATRQLLAGNILKGVSTSAAADIQLLMVAMRKLGEALDYVTSAVSDFVASEINDFTDWFDKSVTDLKEDLELFDEYRRNPNLLVTDAKRLAQDIIDLPSQLIDDFVLEEGCQPRMPWQDVHCKIEGPAAHDVFANFVRRWNAAVLENKDNTAKGIDPSTGLDWRVKPLSAQWLARWGDVSAVFGDISKHGTQGNVSVQVVRSTARMLLQCEAKHAELLPLPGLVGKTAKGSAGYANNTVVGEGNMDGVLEAMIHLVRGAEAYIYIETQFFISDCEKSDNFEGAIATNPLIKELASRIGLAIQTGKAFHVYVVLPVHPEGNLQDGGVAKQHYWALQTIKRGKKSLIWQVCEKIARKHHKVKPGEKAKESDIQALIQSGAWRPYMTFLNLRNWGVTALFPRHKETRERQDHLMPQGRFVITEQIYVHSKLMIVDDAIAIIGSANCNDRSLNGNGDTELASVIVDNDVKPMDLGNGTVVNTRKFARELRVALWEKHLGLRIEGGDYTKGDRVLGAASNTASHKHPGVKLPHPPRTKEDSAKKASSVNLHRPASPATWQAIQAIASANAKLYEEVFQHTPRNSMKYFKDTQTGWPKRASRKVLAAKLLPGIPVKMVQKKVDAVAKQDVLITDFSTLPPQLNATYMIDAPARENKPYADAHVGAPSKVHDVETIADEVLGPNLTGFWVEMPLDFGIRERDSWLKGRLGNKAVAKVNVPSEQGTVVAQTPSTTPPETQTEEGTA